MGVEVLRRRPDTAGTSGSEGRAGGNEPGETPETAPRPDEAEHRQLRDPEHRNARLDGIYAARLRTRFREALELAARDSDPPDLGGGPAGPGGEYPIDAEKVYRDAAVRRRRQRAEFREPLRSGEGIRWGTVQNLIARDAPEVVGDKFQWARSVVKQVLVELLHGPEGSGWRTEARPHPGRPGASQIWIFLTARPRIPAARHPRRPA
jgi:hypothetical protein